MFCPQCRCEYRPGFDTCSDCDIPLVDALEPLPTPPNKGRLVPFFTADTNADIALVSAFLSAAEIDHFVKSEVLSILHPANGPAQVMVRESDLEAAVEALKELDPRFTRDWDG